MKRRFFAHEDATAFVKPISVNKKRKKEGKKRKKEKRGEKERKGRKEEKRGRKT